MIIENIQPDNSKHGAWWNDSQPIMSVSCWVTFSIIFIKIDQSPIG